MIPDFAKDSLTTDQLAGLLGRDAKTLREWRRQKVGPAYFKIGGRVAYLRVDVERWLASNRRAPLQRLTG